MKKLVLIVVVAAAAFAIWRKVEADRTEEAIWAEVTDSVD